MGCWLVNKLPLLVQLLLCLVVFSHQHPTDSFQDVSSEFADIFGRSTANTLSSTYNETAEHSTLILPFRLQSQYAVEVAFNDEPHWLQPDTGSSDTWMILPDFQCVTADGTPTNQSVCNMGQPYLGSFEAIPGKSLNISYGNAMSVSGAFGYVNVTVAGLTLRTQVGLVDRAFYDGNGTVSGLLGLAPGITFQYATSNGSNVDGLEREQYPVFIDTFFANSSISPTFSFAMQPGPLAGYLSFGGVPPVSFDETFATVNYSFIRGIFPNATGQIQYPIQPDGIVLNGQPYNTSFKAVVDTGTYVNRLPEDLADQINAQFDPPAIYNATLDLYLTSCIATPPTFGVTIANQTFAQQRASDAFLPFYEFDGLCATSFFRGFAEVSQEFPDGYFCLGDVFLFNVVAAFDGDGLMHFAPREAVAAEE